MSIITKDEIIKLINSGELSFKPALDQFQVQGHSVDLRLGFTFMIPKLWQVTPKGREGFDISHFDNLSAKRFDVVELEQGQYFDLLPGEYVLVSTLETIKIPNYLMSVLYPRSSTNRKGLSLDLTGIIDAGYEGQLILPMRNNTNAQTVRLYPGERVCQVVFERLDNPVSHVSKYHKRDVIDGAQKENRNEVDYVIKGDIDGLKTNFKI
jgi:dCTP deaminase